MPTPVTRMVLRGAVVEEEVVGEAEDGAFEVRRGRSR